MDIVRSSRVVDPLADVMGAPSSSIELAFVWLFRDVNSVQLVDGFASGNLADLVVERHKDLADLIVVGARFNLKWHLPSPRESCRVAGRRPPQDVL